jgi:hypothetical protein
LPSMVVSEPFQAFLGAGEAIPAVGKRDAIAPRRRARQPGNAWYGTVVVLDENDTRTIILQPLQYSPNIILEARQ